MKIEICELSKVIDNNIILNNVTMSLESGNIYGFIGRNGSGKTMLLKMICGFVIPTQGNILIDGKSILDKNYFNNKNNSNKKINNNQILSIKLTPNK